MRIGSKKANYVDANTMYSEIGLYVPTITADGQGGYTTTYALLETVFGDFRPMDESRKLMDAQITYTRAAKVFIRYDVTITNNYKILAEGETYVIHSLMDVENQFRFYEILMYF